LLPLIVLVLFARVWTRERTLKELFLLISMGPGDSAFVLFFIQARTSSRDPRLYLVDGARSARVQRLASSAQRRDGCA
jgi:hypothetical protein